MVVDEDQLPMGIGLAAHRINARFQHIAFYIVDRHDNRNQWHVRQRLCRKRVCFMEADPDIVLVPQTIVFLVFSV